MMMNISIRIEHELAPEAVEGLRVLNPESMQATAVAQEEKLRYIIAREIGCELEEVVELSIVFIEEGEQ